MTDQHKAELLPYAAKLKEMRSSLFEMFISHSVGEIKGLLAKATTREEALFYQRLLSLKLSLAQEKVVGRELL